MRIMTLEDTEVASVGGSSRLAVHVLHKCALLDLYVVSFVAFKN